MSQGWQSHDRRGQCSCYYSKDSSQLLTGLLLAIGLRRSDFAATRVFCVMRKRRFQLPCIPRASWTSQRLAAYPHFKNAAGRGIGTGYPSGEMRNKQNRHGWVSSPTSQRSILSCPSSSVSFFSAPNRPSGWCPFLYCLVKQSLQRSLKIKSQENLRVSLKESVQAGHG